MRIILVVLVAIFVLTYFMVQGNNYDNWVDLLRNLKSECRKETGITNSSFQKIYQPVLDRSDFSLLKFIHCIVTAGRFVDDEENINYDFLKTQFLNLGVAEDAIDKAAQSCTKQSDDPLLKVSYYYDCYRKYLPQRIFAL